MSITNDVTSSERADHYRRASMWDDSTLAGAVLAWAEQQPNATAVVDREGSVRHTYEQLADDANRVAAFLEMQGVGPDVVVSVQLPNWYETVVVQVGAMIAGAVVNPLLPGYRAREIGHVVERARPRVLFTPSVYRGTEFTPMVQAISTDVDVSPIHVTVNQRDAASRVIPEASATTSHVGRHSASSVSELIFTSGTEATPKGIMHTEETTNFSVRAAHTHLGLSDHDVVWMPSPIGHSTGFNYGVRLALYHGLKLVLQDVWDPGVACNLIEKERCTYTLAATTFLSDVIARAGKHDLSSLTFFGCGGAPVPADLVRAARSSGIDVLRLYGSTEVLVATWNRRETTDERKELTDGIALEHVEVVTRTEEGKVCEPGEPGEVFVRGPNTCVGFFEDPERTKDVFGPDGWVRSGDVAVVDASNHLTVVGRKKEIIIRGGMNIAPREIEDLLVEHPDIEAAAVIGLKHERLGEIACACLVGIGTRELTSSASIIEWLRSRGLATYKLPERVEWVDSLPYTASGKVKKHELLTVIKGAPA